MLYRLKPNEIDADYNTFLKCPASLVAYDDTWTFDYNTGMWEEQSPSTSPSARSRHGSAYDWESDGVVIYGGTTGGFNSSSHVSSGKTWAYDLNANAWEEINFPSATTTTSPTTTTNTPTSTEPPPGADLTLIWIGVGVVGVVIILIVLFVRRR